MRAAQKYTMQKIRHTHWGKNQLFILKFLRIWCLKNVNFVRKWPLENLNFVECVIQKM